MKPMTPDEAAAAMANTQASLDAHGLWEKVCTTCDRVVGGRLAEYGAPTAEGLSRSICPDCYHAGKEFGIIPRFVP